MRKLGIFAHGEEKVSVHRDEPIFDGQFSNRCYQSAVRQAFHNFAEKAEAETAINEWMIVFDHPKYRSEFIMRGKSKEETIKKVNNKS